MLVHGLADYYFDVRTNKLPECIAGGSIDYGSTGASSVSIESGRSDIGAGVSRERNDIRAAIDNAADPAKGIGNTVSADSSMSNQLAIGLLWKLIVLLECRSSSLILLFDKLEDSQTREPSVWETCSTLPSIRIRGSEMQ